MDEKKGFPIPAKGEGKVGADIAPKGKPMGKGLGKAMSKPAGEDSLAGKSMGGIPMAEKKPMEDKPMGGDNTVVKTFEEDGKAVNLVSISVDDDGAIVETFDDDELEDYAENLIKGDDDISNLLVGTIFEGPNAEADAKAAASKLNSEFTLGPDATEDDKADAAVKAQAKALNEDFKGESDGDIGGAMSGLFGSEEYNEENKKLGEELDENEPILGQMEKAGMGL